MSVDAVSIDCRRFSVGNIIDGACPHDLNHITRFDCRPCLSLRVYFMKFCSCFLHAGGIGGCAVVRRG